MLIGYSRPTYTNVTLVGTGVAFLNDEGEATLADGKAQSVARVSWLSATGALLTDYIEIRFSWATAQKLGILGLANLGVPTGTKIVWYGRIGAGTFTENLGGTSLIQDAVTMPDGSVGQWCVTALADTVYTGVAVRIYNDVDGVTHFASDDVVDIGEVWVSAAYEVDIKRTLQDSFNELSLIKTTLTGQPNRVTRGRARSFSVEMVPVEIASTYASGVTVQSVREALTQYAPCVAIPLHRQPGSESGTDADLLHRQVLFGWCSKVGAIQAVEGSRYWSWTADFTESPNV
jgi:hypothetical protein